MDLSGMVPQGVPSMGSDRSVAPTGVDPQSQPGSSPLSLLRLSLGEDPALAMFAAVFNSNHLGCPWVLCKHEGAPVHHAWCPDCQEGTVYGPQMRAEVLSLLSEEGR